MKLRLARLSDADGMYEAFRSVSIKNSDLKSDTISKNGFYEYDLPYKDFKRRVGNGDISLIVEEKGRIVAYLLAYFVKNTLFFLEREQHKDIVLSRVNSANPNAVYIDQLFINKGIPVYVAGKVVDYFDYIMQNEKVPLVLSAIPESPWKNVSSIRFALCRGFKPENIIADKNIALRIFTKKYFSENSI